MATATRVPKDLRTTGSRRARRPARAVIAAEGEGESAIAKKDAKARKKKRTKKKK